MKEQIDPTGQLAMRIRDLFGIMGESQRDWQNEIGFGAEGHRLRQDAAADEEGWVDVEANAALRNYYMVKLGLVMTEASEAFDEMRKHKIEERYYSIDDQNQDKPEGVLSELADVVIRIWSLTGEAGLGAELAEAIIEKLNYNANRAQMHGGKSI